MSAANDVGGSHVLIQCSIYIEGLNKSKKILKENELSPNQVHPRYEAGLTSLHDGVKDFHFVFIKRGDYTLDDQTISIGKDYHLRHNVRTGYETQPPSQSVLQNLFRGSNAAGD
jgi:hypothetical protein